MLRLDCMLSEYISKKLHQATYKLLEDKTYFGEITGLDGVWAEGTNLEDCREELRDVLESWLVVKLRHGDDIPEFDIKNPEAHDKEYA